MWYDLVLCNVHSKVAWGKNVGKIPTQQANKIRGNLTDQGLRKNLEW